MHQFEEFGGGLIHFAFGLVYFGKLEFDFGQNDEEGENGERLLIFLPENGYQSVFRPSEPGKLVSDYLKYTFLALPALGRKPQKTLFVRVKDRD